MNINRENKIELTFIGFGILMVVLVVLFVVQSFSFLLGNVIVAMDKKSNEPKAAIRFQIERAEAVIKK